MIRSLTFTNQFGRSMRCILGEPERSGFAITSISGLGPGNSTVNIHDIATTDGGYFGSARFSSRNIVVNFRLLDVDIDYNYNPVENIRHISYEFFAPKTRTQIVVDTDTRSLFIEGYIESNEPQIFQNGVTLTVSILCPGYYFKMVSPTGTFTEESLYGDGLFQFPFSNESLESPRIEFGSINTEHKHELYYDGDADTGFIMEITFRGRAVTEFTIQNRPLGKTDAGPVGFINESDIDHPIYSWADDNIISRYINIRIADIAARLQGVYSDYIYRSGNRIVISSITGNKSVMFYDVGGTGYNILDAVHHLDWLRLYPGDNEFSIVTDETSVMGFSIDVHYESLYIGV